MPKAARAACVIAFVWSALAALFALAGPIIILPLALIPLMAGIGILRKRAWAAYGFALFLFAQLLVMPFVFLRSGGLRPSDLVVSMAAPLALIPLFLYAGRSLALPGTEHGRPWPWIVASALTTLPLIFVQAFVMPNSSMENTLLVGDRILAQRVPTPNPLRGELIVFSYPIDRHQTFIKRVIGVPGDRIRMSRKVVRRNGAVLDEPYAIYTADSMDSYRDNFPSQPEANAPFVGVAAIEMLRNNVVNGELVVPAGRYFVLGDNRDVSFDSRYWGFISSGEFIARPLLIYDSRNQSSEDIMSGNQGWFRQRRWDRFFRLI
jgi:signal peptidase I